MTSSLTGKPTLDIGYFWLDELVRHTQSGCMMYSDLNTLGKSLV